MGDERILLRFKPNPRPGAMEPSAKQQPPPPSTLIIDRFRALLKEVAGGGEREDVQACEEEVVGAYEEVLGELTFNSKPVITELTIIAGEHREFGQGIADVICERILQVPVGQKLPTLYLLDSIVKNIGREYVKYFAARLPEVFCETYHEVDTTLHNSMYHLFGTWSQVFPSSVRRKIETELQFSLQASKQSPGAVNPSRSESPSPRPGHGIHINPKYLEARQKFEKSTMMHERGTRDNGRIAEFEEALLGQNSAKSPKGWSGASAKFHDGWCHRGISSSLNAYDRKFSVQYHDCDLDDTGDISAVTEATRVRPFAAGRPSTILGSEKPISFSRNDVLRSSGSRNPLRMDHSSSWRESNMPPDAGFQKRETQNPYNLMNGISKQHPRELIDAYGNSRGKNTLPEKPVKIQRVDADGINMEKTTRKWQSTEEEEYIWEDMSPTLTNRKESNNIKPYCPNSEGFGIRNNLRTTATVHDSDFGKNNWRFRSQLPPADEPALSNSGLLRPQMGIGRDDTSHFQGRLYAQEPQKLLYVPSQSQRSLSPRSQGKILFPASGIASVGERVPPYHSLSDVECQFERSTGIFPDSMNAGHVSSAAMDNREAKKPNSPPDVSLIWRPVHKTQSLPHFPVPPHNMDNVSQSDSVDTSRQIVNQGPPPFPPRWQPSEAAGSKVSNPNTTIQISHSGLEQIPVLQFQPYDPCGNIIPSASAQSASHLICQPLNKVQVQGQMSNQSLIPSNSELGSSCSMSRLIDSSFHSNGGALPPLPLGLPPNMGYIDACNSGSRHSAASGSGFSGLISSLVSQGLISLGPAALPKDSIGVEFDPELLKIRYESAINDLYVNLPRQCTTCGLRFECQEEHSNHMDWHVTKNRMSKNRKQKPSRNWFVRAKEWLSGAETLGTDIVPGFLPAETVVDRNEEKELAVPADDNQNLCALCGEPFEDFYSDEADEWMYRGAVYLNAREGSIEGLDRTHLGPIVHAKCRSESSGIQRQL